MRKDHLRDYVTNAFRAYAAEGCPTYEELKARLVNDILSSTNDVLSVCGGISKPTEAAVLAAETKLDTAAGRLSDILAVIRTIEQLEQRNDRDIILTCLKTVYFAEPHRDIEKNDITQRVAMACLEIPVGEATVYRKLRIARNIFALERGLNIDSSST